MILTTKQNLKLQSFRNNNFLQISPALFLGLSFPFSLLLFLSLFLSLVYNIKLEKRWAYREIKADEASCAHTENNITYHYCWYSVLTSL